MKDPAEKKTTSRSTGWRTLLAEDGALPAALARCGADHSQLKPVTDVFPMRINTYFRSLIQTADDPLGRQVIPAPAELEDAAAPLDPLDEEHQSPTPCVIHRYPRRVVFLVSNQCAVYCRFCMRKRRTAGGRQVPAALLAEGMQYIARRTDIDEVILSGGDPLMLPDNRLLHILEALRRIPHIRVLRIHTRMPGVLPQRITRRLARALARFQPLYVNIHFNHPDELTPASEEACRRLADAGIALGSQTVLLRGVNDDPAVLARLMMRLLSIRVRPYYLHQLDHVRGTAHFRVPLEHARELAASLRGRVSGMAVPHFAVDLPGGGGKVALLPDAVIEEGDACWWIRNWQGRRYAYPMR